MISHNRIAACAAAGETETQEFKRTTGQRRATARALCAFLNHHRGRVLFGVESDGRGVGQRVSDHTIEEIAQEIRGIEPPLFPAICELRDSGRLQRIGLDKRGSWQVLE